MSENFTIARAWTKPPSLLPSVFPFRSYTTVGVGVVYSARRRGSGRNAQLGSSWVTICKDIQLLIPETHG